MSTFDIDSSKLDGRFELHSTDASVIALSVSTVSTVESTTWECPVCLEDLNHSHPAVTCGCGYKVCLTCTKAYVLSGSRDPGCMSCDKTWDRSFQYMNFKRTFVNGPLKKHMKDVLLEREMSQMPGSQVHVEEARRKRDRKAELAPFHYKAKLLHNKYWKMLVPVVTGSKTTYHSPLDDPVFKRVCVDLRAMRGHIDSIRKRFTRERIQRQAHAAVIAHNRQAREGAGETIMDAGAPRRRVPKMLCSCPGEECRGFVMTPGYKCAVCDLVLCKECRQPTSDEHECNQDDVQTIELLVRDTKPCPTCAVPISKISGCDQMWCVQCSCAFSWKSSKVVTGRVHNPHYYEWLQTQPGGIRNPGDVECGGAPGVNMLVRESLMLHTRMQQEHLLELNQQLENMRSGVAGAAASTITAHRQAYEDREIALEQMQDVVSKASMNERHLLDVVLNPLRTRVQQAVNNTDLRVRYLLGDINQEHLARVVMQRDNMKQKKQAVCHVWELMHAVLVDYLRTMHDSYIGVHDLPAVQAVEKVRAAHVRAREVLWKTRNYCNRQMKQISRNFRMVVSVMPSNSFVPSDKTNKY